MDALTCANGQLLNCDWSLLYAYVPSQDQH